MERVRVAAVDDHPVVLIGLKAYFTEHAPDIEWVGVAADVEGLVEAVATAATIVLLDVWLRDAAMWHFPLESITGNTVYELGSASSPVRPSTYETTKPLLDGQDNPAVEWNCALTSALTAEVTMRSSVVPPLLSLRKPSQTKNRSERGMTCGWCQRTVRVAW
jgi:hypothetical protein